MKARLEQKMIKYYIKVIQHIPKCHAIIYYGAPINFRTSSVLYKCHTIYNF